MTWWNDFSIRPWSVEVLECAECVTCACATTLSKCAWECVSVQNMSALSDLCRNRSPQTCVPPCGQDECWDIRCGRWLWLSQCLWWRRTPPRRPWQKWPCSWRPRWPLVSIGFWGLSGHVFPFLLYTVFVFRMFFSLHDVAASSLIGSYDLVLTSVVSPFCRRSDVHLLVICYSVKFFHVGFRVSLFVHAHLVLLVLEVALHDRSVIAFLCVIQTLSWFLEFLSFCRVSIISIPLSILQG